MGSAGIVLTKIMCRAMNSSIIDVLTGKTTLSTTARMAIGSVGPDASTQTTQRAPTAESMAAGVDEAAAIISAAKGRI
ncbi:unnamed protein product, partial [marine sediment metagenome]